MTAEETNVSSSDADNSSTNPSEDEKNRTENTGDDPNDEEDGVAAREQNREHDR